MNRRGFLGILASAAAAIAIPFRGRREPPPAPLLDIRTTDPEFEQDVFAALEQFRGFRGKDGELVGHGMLAAPARCPFVFRGDRCGYRGWRGRTCDKTVAACRNPASFGGLSYGGQEVFAAPDGSFAAAGDYHVGEVLEVLPDDRVWIGLGL